MESFWNLFRRYRVTTITRLRSLSFLWFWRENEFATAVAEGLNLMFPNSGLPSLRKIFELDPLFQSKIHSGLRSRHRRGQRQLNFPRLENHFLESQIHCCKIAAFMVSIAPCSARAASREDQQSQQKHGRINQKTLEITIPSVIWALQYRAGSPGKCPTGLIAHPAAWQVLSSIGTAPSGLWSAQYLNFPITDLK